MSLSPQQRKELDTYSDYPTCPNCEHDIFVEGLKGHTDEYTCHNCNWTTKQP